MTIIYLLASDRFSGAEKVVITIIKQLNMKHRCVYVSPRGDIGNVLEAENIEYAPIGGLDSGSVKKVVEKYNPDIIHANDFRASVIASRFSKRCKVISHIHCNPTWINKLSVNSVAYALANSGIHKILNVSDAFCNEYLFRKMIEKKSETIGNPFSVDDIIRQSEEFEDNDKYDLMFVGRLSKEKGPEAFIDIFYELWKNNNDLTAVIIGDGNLKEECVLKVFGLGIADNVTILGFTENPYPYMKNSKIMVVTSVFEGFGLAALEALALGKPVVASKVGGLINIVNDKCGRLCTDKKEFVATVNEILYDSKVYETMSIEAEKQAEKFDNLQTYIEEIEKIYNKCVM